MAVQSLGWGVGGVSQGLGTCCSRDQRVFLVSSLETPGLRPENQGVQGEGLTSPPGWVQARRASALRGLAQEGLQAPAPSWCLATHLDVPGHRLLPTVHLTEQSVQPREPCPQIWPRGLLVSAWVHGPSQSWQQLRPSRKAGQGQLASLARASAALLATVHLLPGP